MTASLNGSVAIVTGAASGIGLATAKRLHADGARIIGFDLVPGPIEEFGDFVRCDIGSAAAVDAAFARLAELTDRVDVLVNNAGIGAIGNVEGAVDDDWNAVLNINVIGTARMSRAALPLLRRSPSASIVNVCSIAATLGLPNRAVYSASNGAVLALTQAMAADHVREGIRVNCVNPGTADTPWVNRLLDAAADPERERAALNSRQPIGRLITAEEVASAVAFLAHPDQSAITGTALAVDGGMAGIRLSN